MTFGTIRQWDASKGFGFIESDDGDDIFLHVSDFGAGVKQTQIREGLRVKFDIKSDFKGDRAVNVRVD